MPLVFSLFFHKVVVCLLLQPSRLRKSLKLHDPSLFTVIPFPRPSNALTPRSIFIHSEYIWTFRLSSPVPLLLAVRKSLKLSQKLSNSVKFTDSLLRLEGRPAFRPDSGGQLMAVDMLLIDAKVNCFHKFNYASDTASDFDYSQIDNPCFWRSESWFLSPWASELV